MGKTVGKGSRWTGTAERARTSRLTAYLDWPLYPLVAKRKTDVEGYFFPIFSGIHLGEICSE